jgi:hypothetical protein
MSYGSSKHCFTLNRLHGVTCRNIGVRIAVLVMATCLLQILSLELRTKNQELASYIFTTEEKRDPGRKSHNGSLAPRSILISGGSALASPEVWTLTKITILVGESRKLKTWAVKANPKPYYSRHLMKLTESSKLRHVCITSNNFIASN